MCCFAALGALVGPRLVIILWWLLDTARWSATFDNVIVPALGFVFVPWTTLLYVYFAPTGLNGLAPIVLVFAVVVDAATYGGGMLGNRPRPAS